MTFKNIDQAIEVLMDDLEEEIINRSGLNNYSKVTLILESILSKLGSPVTRNVFTGSIKVKYIDYYSKLEENFIKPNEDLTFNEIYNYSEYRRALREVFGEESFNEGDGVIMKTYWLVEKEYLINIVREYKRNQYFNVL